MNRLVPCFLFLAGLGLATPAGAEDIMNRQFNTPDDIPVGTPIPQEVLAKNYETCLSKANTSHESAVANQGYCACVRDKLARNWDLRHYVTVAMAQSQSQDIESGMKELQSLADDCVKQWIGK